MSTSTILVPTTSTDVLKTEPGTNWFIFALILAILGAGVGIYMYNNSIKDTVLDTEENKRYFTLEWIYIIVAVILIAWAIWLKMK